MPAVAMQALGVSLLTIVQNALPLYRSMGTPSSIIDALSLCGIAATILEGQNSWGGSTYPSDQGWAAFRITANGIFFNSVTGALNGSNRVFTLPALPNSNSLRVFYNGVLLRPTTDYGVAGLTLTLTFTPDVLSNLGIVYRFGAASTLFMDAVVPTSDGTHLTLPHTPTSLLLYRNGLFQMAGLNPAQMSAVETIVNFFKPARCILDLIAPADYYVTGAVITPSTPPGSDSFIAWGTYVGSSATPNYADFELPGGTINGSNVHFTLAHTPNPTLSLQLFDNIELVKDVDYTITGTAITMVNAPGVGDAFFAFYRY